VLPGLLLHGDCVTCTRRPKSKPKQRGRRLILMFVLGKPLGRIVIELRMDVTPATAENVSFPSSRVFLG
jgi:hypothetical protein